MRLQDVTSPEELAAALERGDQELASELRSEIKRVAVAQSENWQSWESDTGDVFDPDEERDQLLAREDFDPLDLLNSMARDDELEEQVLRLYGEEDARALIRKWLADESFHRSNRHQIFEFSDDPRESYGVGVHVRPVYMELRVLLEEPLSWAPDDFVRGVLEEVAPRAGVDDSSDWENLGDTDFAQWTSGWIESGNHLRLVPTDRARERIVDATTEYFSNLVDLDPAAAAKAIQKYLDKHDPDLGKRLRKYKLPEDVQASLAIALFEDNGGPLGMQAVRETLGAIDVDWDKVPVILEVDRAALRELGITSGRWWDGAPWRLINLPPEALAFEGTMQRHCVGRHDMGYRQAVASGRQQVWSLRSAANIPILTWEVDVHFWNQAGGVSGRMIQLGGRQSHWVDEASCERGRAILQLKGKLNRTSGGKREEAMVLHYIFGRLGIEPYCVDDFVGTDHQDLFPLRTSLDSGEGDWAAQNPYLDYHPSPWWTTKQRLTTW